MSQGHESSQSADGSALFTVLEGRMATIVNETPFTERRVAERRHFPGGAGISVGNAFRVSWAGIWAGVLAALGSLLLLIALGFAVGVSAMDFQNPDAGALGTGTAIWIGLSLLVAMFIGGMLSTRLAMITDRSTGVYEGALVWALGTILILYLAGSGLGTLAGGAFNLVGGAGRSVAAVAGVADLELSQGNVDQMVARLRDPGTARQIATATGLPADEVRSRLEQAARVVQDARDNPAEAAAEVRRSLADLMSRAQPTERLERASRTSAWVTFLALLISLGAAIGGASLGQRRARAQQPGFAPKTTA